MQSGGEIMPVHNSVDTVNAAAAAIVTAGTRTQPPEPRRKWIDKLSAYFCFGSHKNSARRISQAALVPEPAPQRTDAPATDILNHPPPMASPFVAPPSSPVSFHPSEPTSVVQSPLSPNSPPPTGPPSIFAIGPYAHETEVVSPPTFSAFTTEPSTANVTPAPESVNLASPSSPELPYAKVLSPTNNSEDGETGDLQSYPNYPDSPIGRLISPSPCCPGATSPFPDPEMPDGEGVATQKLLPRHMRNGGSLLDGHITAAVPVVDFSARLQPNDHPMDHRISFELTVEDFARCLEKKTAISGDCTSASFRLAPISNGDHPRESADTSAGLHVDETYHDLPEKARRSLSLRMAKEFNFDNMDAANVETSIGSNWWANEKVAGFRTEPKKN